MSNSPTNRERYELRRYGVPTYKHTDLPSLRQPKQQPLQQTTTTTTEQTSVSMHQEGDPPPPQHRATDNLTPDYFRGLSTENADLWMVAIENWRSYRQMNEEQTKSGIRLFCGIVQHSGTRRCRTTKRKPLPNSRPPLKNDIRLRNVISGSVRENSLISIRLLTNPWRIFWPTSRCSQKCRS